MLDVKGHLQGVRGWVAAGSGVQPGRVHAVTDVSFAIAPGETLGLVGRERLRQEHVGALRLAAAPADAWQRALRRPRADGARRPRHASSFAVISKLCFKIPTAHLNPRLTVRQTLGEPLRLHRLAASPGDEEARVGELLRRVGLRPEHMDRYPHEFSRRAAPAGRHRASLVSSSQSWWCVTNRSAPSTFPCRLRSSTSLRDLSDELGLGYLFIAHDLSVVRFMSQRVAVMYLGRIVELGPAQALYEHPRHPYTKALLGRYLKSASALGAAAIIPRICTNDVALPLRR